MDSITKTFSTGCGGRVGVRVTLILLTLVLVTVLASVVGVVVHRSRRRSRPFDAGPGPYVGHGTYFEGMGTPYGGCGVPPSKAVDDNGTALPFVALNTNSVFSEGKNCGRWVEITLQENCVGAGNKKWKACVGGEYVADDETGKVIYGYTMDSCADANFWCRRDDFHLDISEPYLNSLDYVGNVWNGRKVSWDYISSTPKGWKMADPKFMWMQASKWLNEDGSFWAVIIIYNIPDGFSKVEQLEGDGWVEIGMLTHLGNMWELNKPTSSTPRSVVLRITSASGTVYGVFEVEYTCKDECKAAPGVDARAKKITSASCPADGATCRLGST